jgi:ParB family transcriptional regulator, chromosome partitioning protein
MATAKITLSASRDIPFNKLVLSQSNVRRVKAGVSIEELAEDITRRSLLQSLSVRPVLDGDGQETECSRCRPAAAGSGPSSCWSSRSV